MLDQVDYTIIRLHDHLTIKILYDTCVATWGILFDVNISQWDNSC